MQTILSRLRVIRQLLGAFGRSGRWWMLPMVTLLLMLGLVLAGLSAVPYVAPFIYAVL